MPCLPTIIALIFPRATIIVLWFLTDWFNGIFDTIMWPILGLLFAPFTLLWFTAVQHYYGGEWSTIPIIGMIVAVMFDTGTWGSSAKNKGRRG